MAPTRRQKSATVPPSSSALGREVVEGNPDQRHINTSYVERSNLTMRMHMRRFTRLTNAFSKKLENHAAAIALHTMYYNFVRIHQTPKVTPAMAAGVTDKLWEVADIVVIAGAMGASEPASRVQFRRAQVRYRKGLFRQRALARRRGRYDLWI
jgi:hypothetical protein